MVTIEMTPGDFYFEFVMWLQDNEIYLCASHVDIIFPYFLKWHVIKIESNAGELREVRVLHIPK